jgi:trehalose 6-phosphate synthase
MSQKRNFLRHALRFLLPLMLFLGVLAWAASGLINSTSRRWFDRDVTLRAQLAVTGAREALATHWRSSNPAGIARVLSEIALDERVMATAACTLFGDRIAATQGYPARLGCAVVRAHASQAPPDRAPTGFDESILLDGRRLQLNAVPVVDGGEALGYVLLVHDVSFVDQREASTRRILLAAIALVALAAAVVTVLVERFSWRSWTAELRRLLRGTSESREFQPILRDVRELANRLASEQSVGSTGQWCPERLRQALTRHLEGEGVILVANREPYIHAHAGDGSIVVQHPASGLVTALEPVMRACSGVWIGHGAGSADREASDRQGRLRVPPGEESYTLRRVWLSREEEQGYYYGFSNEGLWPLCHVVHTRPTFRAEDWETYAHVNRKFADAVCSEAKSDDPIVMVQDYHFALLPQMLRQRLPRATVITFWHIPWPNSEQFGICPWYQEILRGLLGSSILGFHTQYHCNHFIDAVDRYLEARIDREQQAIILDGRPTLVRAYPISVDWPNRWAQGTPPAEECRLQVRRELGLAPNALLGVGVDRLDYTKGIEERLLAVDRLLERHPQFRGRFVFVQLAAPSRTAIERYRQLNLSVEAAAARINKRFGTPGYQPIVLLREHHEPPAIFRYYRAADLCYVSSLHDGMNLVAKEFVASRDDERGVLVLSRFTGAARELPEALVVNPYDLEEASSALAAALTMSRREQGERMRAMRALLSEFNVYRWAGRMLVDAARLRRRDRFSWRLFEVLRRAGNG